MRPDSGDSGGRLGVHSRLPGRSCRAPTGLGVRMHDLLFIALIVALFGLLALCAKAAEKL